jgi:hypothetical protein
MLPHGIALCLPPPDAPLCPLVSCSSLVATMSFYGRNLCVGQYRGVLVG